jgi:hypothetical protein
VAVDYMQFLCSKGNTRNFLLVKKHGTGNAHNFLLMKEHGRHLIKKGRSCLEESTKMDPKECS